MAKQYFEKYIAMYPDGATPTIQWENFTWTPAILRMLKNITRWRWRNIRLQQLYRRAYKKLNADKKK